MLAPTLEILQFEDLVICEKTSAHNLWIDVIMFTQAKRNLGSSMQAMSETYYSIVSTEYVQNSLHILLGSKFPVKETFL